MQEINVKAKPSESTKNEGISEGASQAKSPESMSQQVQAPKKFVTPTEAYQQVKSAVDLIRLTVEQTKELYGQYGNPFSVEFEVEHIFTLLRGKTIRSSVESFRKQYTPNLQVEQGDFLKLMDEKAGKEEFSEAILEEWFKAKAEAKDSLTQESLHDLRNKANQILPVIWGSWERRRSEENDIVEGQTLILKAYTWDKSYGKGSVRLWKYVDSILALEKLIAVSEGQDPITARAEIGITNITSEQRRPDLFYAKHEPNHSVVKSFKFYKNGKFTVEFKTREQARKVACLLLGEPYEPEIPQDTL